MTPMKPEDSEDPNPNSDTEMHMIGQFPLYIHRPTTTSYSLICPSPFFPKLFESLISIIAKELTSLIRAK
jgi:hypothetical protein